MKYRELIHFVPINEVVKFERLGSDDYRQCLICNLVSSEAYEKSIIPALCLNLDYTANYETYGLQIVGLQSYSFFLILPIIPHIIIRCLYYISIK